MFDGCTPLVLSTSQSIPKAVQSYSFDIELVNSSSNIKFSIGIKSDSSFVRYSTDNGDIQEDENVIHKTEAAEPNTIISCHLQKLKYFGSTIQKCTFIKNETKLGTWYVEGKHLRPSIWFHPTTDQSQTAEIKTCLESNKYRGEIK